MKKHPAKKIAPAKKVPAKKVTGKKRKTADAEDYIPDEKDVEDEAEDIKLEPELDGDDDDKDDYGPDDDDELYEKEEGPPPGRKRFPKGTRTIVRVDPVTKEHKRVKYVQKSPKSTDPLFLEQLHILLETGKCPKCHGVLQKGHERHLKLCKGVTEDSIRRNNEREVMASIPKDILKSKSAEAQTMKLMARLRKVKISGLKSRSDLSAKFIVTGSTGRGYEINLSDGSKSGPYSGFPRRCNCVDARTKRHDCKHCSAVILALGFDLNVSDEEWNSMWRMHLDENIDRFPQL